MGWKLARYELCCCDQIKPNEEKDICIILHEEKRAVIHGEVKFPSGKPVKGAVVKLFKKKDSKDCCDTCDLQPITFAFTDECGRFMFGVDAEEDYIIMASFYKPERPYPPRDKFDGEELVN